MASKSLLRLYQELSKEGVTSILRTRLEQYCPESMLILTCALGIYKTHPTPLECLKRLRAKSFCESPTYLMTKKNVKIDEETVKFISFSVVPSEVSVNLEKNRKEE